MKNLLLCTILAIGAALSVSAQKSDDIKFKYLNTEDGLSHTSVLTLYEDEYGFIWMGTKEGLNRYNGTRIERYDLNRESRNGQVSNNIKRLTGDKEGNLFLLSVDGLARYNYDLDLFDTLWHDAEIGTILYSDGRLYVGRGDGLFVFDEVAEQFISKYVLPNGEKITALLKLDDLFYIGTCNGLYHYSTTTKEMGKVIQEQCDVSFLYKDSNEQVWVSTWDNGLFCIKNREVTNHFTSTGKKGVTLSSNFVRECCEDEYGNLWIGTFSGLNRYNSTTKEISHIVPSNQKGGLSHSSVWSIIKDKQGSIWLSTYFGGVNYFNLTQRINKEYTESKIESEGLSSPIVSQMTEDDKHNLWICTEGAGVNLLNRGTDTFKWYLPDNSKNSISSANIKTLYFDKERAYMWFGSHLGGLSRLDLKRQRFKHYQHNSKDSSSLPSNILRDILPYKEELILATDRGVVHFNVAHESFTPLANLNIVDAYAILIDEKENLWVSVLGEGVFKYNLKEKRCVAHYSTSSEDYHITSNNVNSIYKDSANNIYLCTSGGGIDQISSKGEIFNYRVQNGLISNITYNIAEITPSKFIVTTNLGISIFDGKSNTFSNFTDYKGYPLTSINDNALYVAQDKEIYIGGINGLVAFYLEDLASPNKPYNIYFDRLFIDNKEVTLHDEAGILKQRLEKTDKIVIPHNYSFGIDITTNNYLSNHKNQLSYQLVGFSKEWIPLENSNNRITYTNLEHGKYRLLVKDQSDSAEINHEATLEIIILPPWYLTIWAYLLYVGVATLILFYFLRAYKRRVDLLTSLKYEQEHTENVERLNQSKLNFFTNISHEFRTPLTVIISQLDYLLKYDKFTSDIYNKLLNIYKNSLQLNELTTELLDFRKQEAGKVQLHIAKHDIVQFLNENYILFKEFAEIKQIEFSFKSSEKSLDAWYDTAQLQKVINNLLSNAFKYTKKGEQIELLLNRDDRNLLIYVKDTGEGINKRSLKHIFERFYQVDDSNLLNAGSGIGLALSKGIIELHRGAITVESEPGKGTKFCIKIPLGNNHFTAEELLNSVEEDKFSNESLLKELNLFKEQQKEEDKNEIPKETKLLIVEDNHDLRKTLAELFKHYYTVFEAADGCEALQLVETEMPELVISDIVMPNMTGIELCKKIKANVNSCHIPVVLLTAKTSLEHNLEGLRIGADDYISKPFNPEILVSRCNNLINSRRLLHEVFSKQPQVAPQKLATNPIDKEVIDRATAIIEQNIDNVQFSINDFAQEMGMSRTNLFNKIKSLTGQTPNNFILTMRLKRAAYLLRNNLELNISDIANITGFNTSHYFSKCFKDTYQKTPTSYREEGT